MIARHRKDVTVDHNCNYGTVTDANHHRGVTVSHTNHHRTVTMGHVNQQGNES